MCTVASARAQEVQFGIDQGIDVTSNVLNSVFDPMTDGFYRITPSVAVRRPESDFTFTLEYRPTISAYFRTNDINGVDHYLLGRSRYQFNARDALKLRANFIRVRGIRSNTFTDLLGQTQVIPTQLGTTQRFDTELSLEHGFSARTLGQVGVEYDRWDYSVPDRVGNQGLGANGRLLYAFSSRFTVGLDVDARYRSFEETTTAPGSYSTVLNANAVASIQVADKTRLELTGGPAGVFSRQGVPDPRFVSRWSPVLFDPILCPVGPCARVWGAAPPAPTTTNCGTSLGLPVLGACGLTPGPVTTVPGFPTELVLAPLDPSQNVFGRSTETLTYFVSIALSQRFRRGSLNLSFVRNEDGGSGIGATTIVNSASASFGYALSDLWDLRVTGSYFGRESVSRFPVTSVSARASTATVGGLALAEANTIIAQLSAQRFQQDIGVAELSLLRQLGERSSIRFRFQYYKQTQDVSGATNRVGFDKFVGGVFYVYTFEPYKL